MFARFPRMGKYCPVRYCIVLYSHIRLRSSAALEVGFFGSLVVGLDMAIL
jgi:hypothetical protein